MDAVRSHSHRAFPWGHNGRNGSLCIDLSSPHTCFRKHRTFPKVSGRGSFKGSFRKLFCFFMVGVGVVFWFLVLFGFSPENFTNLKKKKKHPDSKISEIWISNSKLWILLSIPCFWYCITVMQVHILCNFLWICNYFKVKKSSLKSNPYGSPKPSQYALSLKSHRACLLTSWEHRI